jgi:hypothetical protein
MQGRQGPQEQPLSIRDTGGKVAAQLSGGRGGPVDLKDISKKGNDLLLKFERSFQGQSVDVVMTLALQPDGTVKVSQDFAGGQFSQGGTGKKKM